MKNINSLLYVGIAAIIINITYTILLAFLYPKYSHVSQIISELGMENAPYPEVFGFMEILTGCLLIISSLGIVTSLNRVSNKKTLVKVSAFCAALFGVNYIFSGSFSLPDERHNGYGLGAAIIIAPLFFAWAVTGIQKQSLFKVFHIGAFIIFIVTITIMVTFSDMSNQGLFQRLLVFTNFLWLFITYVYLLKQENNSNFKE